MLLMLSSCEQKVSAEGRLVLRAVLFQIFEGGNLVKGSLRLAEGQELKVAVFLLVQVKHVTPPPSRSTVVALLRRRDQRRRWAGTRARGIDDGQELGGQQGGMQESILLWSWR